MKKIGKAIARKFKNWKGSPIATTAKGAAIEELRTSNMQENVEEVKVEVKEQTNVTETDIQLCEDINESREDLQLMDEINEETQNNLTTVEPTSEPCFDSRSGNDVDEKNKPLTQQRQAILAGFVGTALLVSSVALCIMEMHVIAVIGGIVGLVCMGFALYNAIKPNTKLEKVEDVEQPIIQSSLNLS